MAPARHSISAGIRARHALGSVLRSTPLRRTVDFVALQLRRVRQRLGRRFVRGVWIRTRDYLARAPREWAGFFYPAAEPRGKTAVDGPTFAPNSAVNSVGGPIVVRFGRRAVAALIRPWVVGTDGAVIARDGRLLWDLSYAWPGQPHRHPAYALGPWAAAELPGVTATLAAMAADRNYFHFLLNSLARLAYLVRTRALEVADRFLVSGCVDNFTADALALFGIPRDRLVGTNDSAAFRPDLLLAPPLIVDPFVVPAHVCDFIRSAVLRSLPPRRRRRRRIFVDRSDAGTRRIVNLDALQPTLAAFGIETVRLAGRSLSEQAALFNECELVIANHGAALANLVFCEPGTRVLQILAPGMMEREYRTVSQHGRLRHDYLVARFASDADAHLPRKHRDLRLSPALLRRVLDADASVSSTSPPCKTPSPSARPSSSARRTIRLR